MQFCLETMLANLKLNILKKYLIVIIGTQALKKLYIAYVREQLKLHRLEYQADFYKIQQCLTNGTNKEQIVGVPSDTSGPRAF